MPLILIVICAKKWKKKKVSLSVFEKKDENIKKTCV